MNNIEIMNDRNQMVNFISGIATGSLNSVLFNPYDKALYNMMKNQTKFFNVNNWKNPYYGVRQALGHRIISYGLYFPFVDLYNTYLPKMNNTRHKSILVSSLTGTTTAILLNPINVIKTQNWNQNTSHGLFRLGKQIYVKHGASAFMRSIKYSFTKKILINI